MTRPLVHFVLVHEGLAQEFVISYAGQAIHLC